MQCKTHKDGVITDGIRLAMDPPATLDGKAKYFIYVEPDHYGELPNVEELIASGCARRDGDDVILLRCTMNGGTPVPETEPDGKVMVLGSIDHGHAEFGAGVVAPVSYRTALGVNWCCAIPISRLVNRVMGKTTGHERYNFLAIFAEGDSIKCAVIFEDDGNERIDLWAEGTLLSYSGGELRSHKVSVVKASERFARCA